jgi:glycerophosphoryl diester phosphodiesterase
MIGGEMSRRTMLGGIGLCTAALLGGGAAAYLLDGRQNAGSATLDVARWSRTRGPRYHIGHRGAGDVRPEHTMVSYQTAADWGVQVLEVSTSSTSDGVLVCMHDLTLDRTTNGSGPVNAHTWAQLSKLRVIQPQLGPAWSNVPIPQLEQVLTTFGGRLVLCLEAKRYEDYPLMMDLVAKHGLQKSVIVKAFHASNAIADAKSSGYPVFSYFGVPDVGLAAIAEAAKPLNAGTDYLVLPTTSSATGDQLLPAQYLEAALATGLPVWVYPVHRRYEADYFFGLGVSGLITPNYRYISSRTPSTRFDNWSSKAVASGEMNEVPDEKTYAPQWTGVDELTLAKRDSQHFITLGQFAPLANATGSYQIDLQAQWNLLPQDTSTGIAIAFGHADDRYWEDGLGSSDGYHALLTADGSLELYSHLAGQRAGQLLAQPLQTPAPVLGQWMILRLTVFPQGISWSRLDATAADSGSAAQVTADDRRFRGGYLHLGRTSAERSSVSFRALTVS